MDNALPPDDKEVGRLLLIKAVEEARRDPRPSISNEVVGAKLEAKIKELERKIATSLGTTEVLDDEEADRRLMAKAVEQALQNQSPGRLHAEVRLDMLKKINELDEKIAARLAE